MSDGRSPGARSPGARPTRAPIVVAVFAHNEAARIAACLASLPLDDPGVAVHVVVNGSTDGTAAIAATVARGRAVIHDYRQGGKARSWNRFVLTEAPDDARTFVFVDGDAQVSAGSIAALDRALAADPRANAASGMPLNGRRATAYRASLMTDRGLFGDLYALRGDFVRRLRHAGIRLPDDLVGDDGLLAAMAKTDLGDESGWDDARVTPCAEAGFTCAPTTLASPATWVVQYRRMISYAVRHFQNRMISDIMAKAGPAGLPATLATLYPAWLDRFEPRSGVANAWFDRRALARMRAASRR